MKKKGDNEKPVRNSTGHVQPKKKEKAKKRSFTINEVEKITGVKGKIIKMWQSAEYLRLGWKIKGGVKGDHVYLIEDLFKVVLFARLISVGATKQAAGKTTMDPITWRQTSIKLIGPFTKTEVNIMGIMVYIGKRIEQLYQ